MAYHADPIVLLLLDRSALAAAVAWPRVPRGEEREQWAKYPGQEIWYDFDKWMELTGLCAEDLLKASRILFGHDLAKPGGEVDETVFKKARQTVRHELRK